MLVTAPGFDAETFAAKLKQDGVATMAVGVGLVVVGVTWSTVSGLSYRSAPA